MFVLFLLLKKYEQSKNIAIFVVFHLIALVHISSGGSRLCYK